MLGGVEEGFVVLMEVWRKALWCRGRFCGVMELWKETL